MLTFVVRNGDGSPRDDTAGRPLTITVTPWFAPSTNLPDGPPSEATRALLPGGPDIERVIDHVAAWSGWAYRGRPLRCSRNPLRAVLSSAPHVLEQIQHEINVATTSGVLN